MPTIAGHLRRRTLPLLLALGTGIGAVLAAETEWKEYVNARFGFRLSYPAILVASREPDNGGGREFHTPDKSFSLAAYAHFFVDDVDSFEDRWQNELKSNGDTITYKKKTKTWYVVSGVAKDGTEYYHKLQVNGKNWAAFDITYPHSQHEKYDAWVERIARSFVPFLPGDYDRLE